MKNSEYKKLEDSNADYKRQGYERKIEDLSRQLHNMEKKRVDVQNTLESQHSQWSCNLELFVTDMNSSSTKTQADLKKIKESLDQMQVVGEKQADLLHKRQQLLQENYEKAEKQELTWQLEDQIQDCDQMINDTKEQIKEIQDQINRINLALEERQLIINDQILELNHLRQQKIDLDK